MAISAATPPTVVAPLSALRLRATLLFYCRNREKRKFHQIDRKRANSIRLPSPEFKDKLGDQRLNVRHSRTSEFQEKGKTTGVFKLGFLEMKLVVSRVTWVRAQSV